ncbi:MAG: molybdenum cofactor guanylyltransferase MobA [Aquincola tertiaricarbonis]
MNMSDITGLVLAGGLGRRMGGVDKGLQPFEGQPLARRALERLRPQVGPLMLNANRHLDVYAAWGVPVWPDADDQFAGPLAGMLAGLRHADTPWLACVPCDGPHFPPDLVQRLAAHAEAADVVMPVTLDPDTGRRQPQPVFGLLRRSLADDLAGFLADGGRQVEAWAARLRCVQVPFADARAFANANTAQDLARLSRP